MASGLTKGRAYTQNHGFRLDKGEGQNTPWTMALGLTEGSAYTQNHGFRFDKG